MLNTKRMRRWSEYRGPGKDILRFSRCFSGPQQMCFPVLQLRYYLHVCWIFSLHIYCGKPRTLYLRYLYRKIEHMCSENVILGQVGIGERQATYKALIWLRLALISKHLLRIPSAPNTQYINKYNTVNPRQDKKIRTKIQWGVQVYPSNWFDEPSQCNDNLSETRPSTYCAWLSNRT